MKKYLSLFFLFPFLFGFTWNGATIATWNGATIATWNGAAANSCSATIPTFTAVTNGTTSTLYTSNTVTITLTGCSSAAISISGNSGQYKINSGSYTASAGTINTGDTVTVRQTSSGSIGVKTTTTLTVAGSSQAYDVDTNPAYSSPIEVQIASGQADVSVYYDPNYSMFVFSVYDYGLTIGRSVATKQYGCGLRFAGVYIPSNATITTAYLIVTSSGNMSSTTVNSRITGQLHASPTAIANISDYVSRRGTAVGGANNDNRTTAQVNWDNIPAWTNNTVYNSPEIKTIIQEIVTSEGATTSLVLFWDDHDDRTTASSSIYRAVYDYETYPDKTVKIHIEYTTP